MSKRKAREALRISNLKDMYERVCAIHAEFHRIREERPETVDYDIVNIESHLHRIAQGAYNVCEFGKRKDGSRLSGQFQTAFITCKTYEDRIGPVVTLFQQVVH